MVKIGNVSVSGYVLAPMAGVTDVAFRELCLRLGAGLVCTEMVSSEAAVRDVEMKRSLFDSKPVSVQIFGSDIDNLVKTAKMIETKGASIIDLNCGCPDRQIIAQGAGSALLRDVDKIGKIISALVKAVSIPVTAKIRIGIDGLDVGVEAAKEIESNGGAAVAVHARTMEQGYSGEADWSAIKLIKESVSIPVIGNGDVFSKSDASKMLSDTGCDLVMIGRGAMGNPCIFSSEECDKVKLFFDWLKLAKKYDCCRFVDVKRQALYFIKGIPGCVSLKKKISVSKDTEEIKELIKEFRDKIAKSL